MREDMPKTTGFMGFWGATNEDMPREWLLDIKQRAGGCQQLADHCGGELPKDGQRRWAQVFLASKIDLGANVRWMIANGGKIWKNGIQPGRVGILHGDLMEYQDYFKEFGRLSNRIVMYEMRKLVSLSAFCVQAFQEPFSWVTIDTEIGFRNTAKTLLAAGM